MPIARPRKKQEVSISSRTRPKPAPIVPSRHLRFYSTLLTAFILCILADLRATIEEMLHEDPAFTTSGCYASLSTFDSLSLLLRFVASSLALVLPWGLQEASR